MKIKHNGDTVGEKDIAVPAGCSPRMQREANDPLCASADIVLDLIEGENSLDISVYEDVGSVRILENKEFFGLSFESNEAGPLVIMAYKPCVDIYGDVYCNESYYLDAVDHVFYAAKMLPYKFSDVYVVDTERAILSAFHGVSEGVLIDHVRAWAINILEEMSELVKESVRDGEIDGIAFGLAVWGEEVPEAAFHTLGGRVNDIPGNAMVMRRFDMAFGDKRALAMHEIGHLFGRHHVPGGGLPPSICAPLGGAAPQWPYETPHLHSLAYRVGEKLYEVGFDVMDMRPKVSPDHYEVMAYCNRQWVSPFTYDAIMNQILR